MSAPGFMSRLGASSGAPSNYYAPPSSGKGGGGGFIYGLLADVVVLLIGVILIIVSQAKCREDGDSTECRNYRIAGGSFIAISSVILIIMLVLKFKR